MLSFCLVVCQQNCRTTLSGISCLVDQFVMSSKSPTKLLGGGGGNEHVMTAWSWSDIKLIIFNQYPDGIQKSETEYYGGVIRCIICPQHFAHRKHQAPHLSSAICGRIMKGREHIDV